MSDPKTIMASAQAFTNKNIVQLCRELEEFDDTGLLSDGLIDELVSILKGLEAASALRMAENMIRSKAVSIVADLDD